MKSNSVYDTDSYNYQPPEGTQTVADILKISLTSDFTSDEAVGQNILQYPVDLFE